MKNRFSYKLLLIQVLAVIAAAVSSCVNSNSLCPEDQPGYVEGDNIWFTFKVRNLSPSSRADDSQGHPEEDALAAENYINIDDRDISVLLFANDNGNVWLMKVLTNEEYSVERASGADNSSLYNLSFKINRQYFAYAGSGDAKFSLMVVANMKGTGDYSDPLYNSNDHFAYSPQRLAALKLYYGMPDQSATAWLPSVTEKKLIPMSGILPCTVSQTALQNSSDAYNPLKLGEVEMQRAMAKIRILDAIKNSADNPDGEYIASVTLKGASTRGSFIPESDDWAAGTCELENATWLYDWYDAQLPIHLTAPAIYPQDNTKTYLIGYLPECGSEVFADNTLSPVLEIVINNSSNQQTTYSVKLSEANVKAIARNHIYQFEIEKKFSSQPTVGYTVCEWNEDNADIGFN